MSELTDLAQRYDDLVAAETLALSTGGWETGAIDLEHINLELLNVGRRVGVLVGIVSGRQAAHVEAGGFLVCADQPDDIEIAAVRALMDDDD